MANLAELILQSGRAAVELALFVLLPVMVVMLSLMRLMEARNLLDRLVNLPVPKPSTWKEQLDGPWGASRAATGKAQRGGIVVLLQRVVTQPGAARGVHQGS